MLLASRLVITLIVINSNKNQLTTSVFFKPKRNMKHLDNLTTLLGRPVSPKDFELHHQLKLLKIEVAKVQAEIREKKNETLLTESLLNSTIEDLRLSNLKIRKLRREQLDAKAKEIQFREKQLEQITSSMTCLLYTSPSPRDATLSRMPSSA